MNADSNFIYSASTATLIPPTVTALPLPFTSAPATVSAIADLPTAFPRSASLLFIAQTVENYQSLMAGVAPETEVQLLDGTQDAIAQITNVLAGRSDIASLHIVSHGDVGELKLGNSPLSLQTLPTYTSQIQSWAQALAPDADILLYGCNVAQGAIGQAFVQSLSQLTQADIAASTDITGQAGNWILEYQQGHIEATNPFNPNTLSQFQGNLLGSDFDNNGFSDLVMYDYYDGTTYLQLVDGATVTTQYLATAGYGWQLAGLADFDANGYQDLVWHNVLTGDTGLWLMAGTNLLLSVGLPNTGADNDWQIVGLGDFDSNGTPDILWRSKTLEVTGIWLMNGVAYTGSIGIPTRSNDWVVSGVKDFNNDGIVDILWRNPLTGTNEIWCMNGANVIAAIALPDQASPWVITDFGDWNTDGSTDLLWRNAETGETAIWTLNIGNFAANFNIAIPGNGAGWTVIGSRDLDGNNTPDLIVRNYLTGDQAAWMMDTTDYTNTVNLTNIAGLWDIVA
jgi:hypothetical protein